MSLTQMIGLTEQTEQNKETEWAEYTEQAEQIENTEYTNYIEKDAILKDLLERIYRSNFDLVHLTSPDANSVKQL